MELAGSEVFFCVAGSVGHSEDVEGPATGSSDFLERVSRLLLKRSCDLVFSSSIVALGN